VNLLTLPQTITLEIDRDELTGEMRQIRETNLEPRLEEPGLDHRLLELLRMNPDLDIPHFLATRAAAVFSRPA
jgi:hypothetical protein